MNGGIRMLLEGSIVAKKIIADLQPELDRVKAAGIFPTLKVIILGDDLSAMAYVRMIERHFEKNGFKAEVVRLQADMTEEAFLDYIRVINDDVHTHGVLIQMPLPSHIKGENVFKTLSPLKDVDGSHAVNMGKLVLGEDTFNPCTPYGIIKLMEHYEIPFEGRLAVVIGRSNIVGKPIAMLMLNRNATVLCTHSRTKDLKSLTLQADIVVAAVGKPRFLTHDMVKEGAVVIDVGIHDIDGTIVGDVDFDSVHSKASHITPVPGGVGSTTIATLMENTLKAAKLQHGL